MSLPSTPSKRPYDRSPTDLNEKGKWQKSGGFHPQLQPLKISPGSTVFRVLCPISKSGSVIGKGGTIISQIRQETGAKVRVEEPVPGDDERVIVIVGPDKEVEVSDEKNKEDGEDNNVFEDSGDVKEHNENKEDQEDAPVEDSQSAKATSSVQKALLRVFERMVEGEPDNDKGDEESKNSSSFFVRLLVLSSQVGCLLGKGGRVIKQMSAESGAQIRILPSDKLPLCASPFDELVQLTGGLGQVKKALQSVSQQLLKNPSRDHDSFPASKPSGPSSQPHGPLLKPEVHPPLSHYHFPAQGAPFNSGPHDRANYHSSNPPSIPRYRESVIPSRMRPLDVTFRLLCHNEKVGGVIGKGGTIIKSLQHETGCDIKILEGVPDSEDRIIVISGPVHPDDRISAAQDAVLRVQGRIVSAVPDSNEKLVSRLLVSSNQIGCLLGKGGSIIAEMRKLSGTHIRILAKDQIPKYASENEEVVQITGEFESVQEALLQITTRLQHHLFRDTFTSIHYPAHPSFPDQAPPFPSYILRREPSPPGMFPNLVPSFHKFGTYGGLSPHGRILPHSDRSAFLHNIHRPGIPPHSSGRMPPPGPWEPQGINDGGGPMGLSDYSGGPPHRRIGGFGGGGRPTIITSTSIEVVVPQAIVPSIYGEDGGSLKKIRQISGAKITITEPRPGATETVIIISGTPERTHAAQSLIQAFVMSETDSLSNKADSRRQKEA